MTRKKVKRGAIVGGLFAGVAYFLSYRFGFNSTTLSIILYLYVILGALVAFDFQEFVKTREFLEKIVIVAEEEELKMKKVFTGEKYKIDGTVEKV